MAAIPGSRELVEAFVEEERHQLEEELSDADLYPLVSVGVVYRF